MQQSGCDGGDTSVNSNGLRAYPPCSLGGTGPVWHAVRRYDRTTLQPIPFPGGFGHDGSMLVVDTESVLTGDRFPLAGIAVKKGALYVSSSLTNSIKVYDAAALQFRYAFAVQSPDELAFDSAGFLWVIRRSGDLAGQSARISRYSVRGELQSGQILLGPAIQPTALSFDQDDRWLLADNGVDQNIKIYIDRGGVRHL